MLNRSTRRAVALAGGAAAFVGGVTGLPIPFGALDVILNVVLASAAATGLYLVMPRTVDIQLAAEQAELAGIADQPGIDKRDVLAAIRQGTDKVTSIRNAAVNIRNPNAARRVRSICSTGDDIIRNFREDPKDVRIARTWLNSYLDQTLNIVQQYARVSSAQHDAKAITTMTQFEETLDVIDSTFKDLLRRLLANDVVDLEVDMQVARTMMRQEGS